MAGCSLEGPRKVTLVEGLPGTENVVQLDGVAVDRFDQDRLASRAVVKTARADRAAGTIDGDEVQIEVFDRAPPGEVAARIEAPHATAQHGIASLQGGVVIKDREERVLRSQTMIYDAAKETVVAPKEVTIEGANFRAQGTSLLYARAGELVELSGPLTATVTPDRPVSQRPRGASRTSAQPREGSR